MSVRTGNESLSHSSFAFSHVIREASSPIRKVNVIFSQKVWTNLTANKRFHYLSTQNSFFQKKGNFSLIFTTHLITLKIRLSGLLWILIVPDIWWSVYCHIFSLFSTSLSETALSMVWHVENCRFFSVVVSWMLKNSFKKYCGSKQQFFKDSTKELIFTNFDWKEGCVLEHAYPSSILYKIFIFWRHKKV